MKVSEIINEYDEDHANSLPVEQKVRWLNHLESRIRSEIIDGYDNETPADILESMFSDDDDGYVEGYTLYLGGQGDGEEDQEEFGLDTKLVVPMPYADLYLYYLEYREARSHNETQRYNSASQLFNKAYLDFQQYYNRTHTKRQPRVHLFQHRSLF